MEQDAALGNGTYQSRGKKRRKKNHASKHTTAIFTSSHLLRDGVRIGAALLIADTMAFPFAVLRCHCSQCFEHEGSFVLGGSPYVCARGL